MTVVLALEAEKPGMEAITWRQWRSSKRVDEKWMKLQKQVGSSRDSILYVRSLLFKKVALGFDRSLPLIVENWRDI